MKNAPTSLYRLQLTKTFTLKDATALLPDLHRLGIEGIYCSSYFEAYSPHGYDITDPNKINPKLATPKEYEAFCKKLHDLKMVHIADVVPNHMGIKGDNEWWKDVLKNGPHSKYAKFFDIDWSQGKILVPLLDNKDKEIEEKYYKLVPYQTSATKTSYRRFFNINELIGIRIEDPEVLRKHHQLLFKLLKEKKIDGLRIDHPDGLYDPAEYFKQLRKKHKGLIFVEKILGWQEKLPDWDVDGTVGYEFAHILTGLFVKKNEKLTQVYERFIGKKQNFEEMLYHNKKSYLQKEMQGDIDNLSKTLKSPFQQKDLTNAILELLSCFPIYRTYIPPKGPIPKRDKSYLEKAFQKASQRKPKLKTVFDFLKKNHRSFFLHFQQLSAPAMAKGFEDITLYQYNRLLALNDVGFDPSRHGVTKEEFHQFCTEKQKHYPLGLLSTSTHDSKRSFDVRMQIATLSQIPNEWEKALKTFAKLNEKHKINGFPDRNTEYFLYQTLLGVWPSKPSFRRLWQSLQKSIREARIHTSWQYPNPAYESACKNFLSAILKKNSPFLKAFSVLQKKLFEYGEFNSLSATALKLGAPGIVDIYEGCENFRYTLVDPDNRTPVNFNQKKTLKYELHQKALNFRKDHSELFLKGEYIPLQVEGPQSENIIAYLRTYKNKRLLVAGMRFFPLVGKLEGTTIILPKDLGEGVELFSNKPLIGEQIEIRKLFSEAPFAWGIW